MKKASNCIEAFFISYKTVVLTHLLVNFLLIHMITFNKVNQGLQFIC